MTDAGDILLWVVESDFGLSGDEEGGDKGTELHDGCFAEGLGCLRKGVCGIFSCCWKAVLRGGRVDDL